jgi:cytochrome c2
LYKIFSAQQDNNMNRLLIESFEGRLLLGITSFVVVMILVGWIAINEPARMASFELQHTGRSIERGAELFAANCSTCHNKDGRGQAGRAPGLNNPQLFGVNFVADINNQILRLERNLVELNNDDPAATPDKKGLIIQLGIEREAVFGELGDAATSDERKTELTTRLQEIDAQLSITTEAQAALDALLAERTTLTAELAAAETTDERKVEIQDRLEAITTEITPTEADSLQLRVAKYEALLATLYPLRDAQLNALSNPIDVKDYLPRFYALIKSATDPIHERFEFTNYLINDSNRLTQVGWGGDLRSYVTTTLVHGRPGSNSVWEGTAMVAWAQSGGGPLRDDQIEDIVNFILNYDKGDAWTLEDLYAVNQFGKLHGGGEPAVIVDTLESLFNGDAKAATDAVVALTGDPARGDTLYHGSIRTGANKTLGCKSCHVGGSQAPETVGTWARVTNERITLPEFAGYTPEQYIIESIMSPNAYTVPPYAGIMPTTLAGWLTPQDMADILAYLKTQ